MPQSLCIQIKISSLIHELHRMNPKLGEISKIDFKQKIVFVRGENDQIDKHVYHIETQKYSKYLRYRGKKLKITQRLQGVTAKLFVKQQ